jgi:hypothetical protein
MIRSTAARKATSSTAVAVRRWSAFSGRGWHDVIDQGIGGQPHGDDLMGGQSCRQAAYQRRLDHRVSLLAACFLKITVDYMDGCPRRCLAFTMLGTLGELSLFALVFSDFLIEGAHRGGLCV